MRLNKLTESQLKAMKASVLVGKALQAEYAEEIREDIRNERTYGQIIRRRKLDKRFHDRKREVIKQGLIRACYGHDGSLGVDAYEGLLPEQEMREITLRKRKRNGQRAHEQGIGMYGALTLEDRNRIGAQALRSLSPEKRRESTELGLLSRGCVQWGEDEVEDIRIWLADPKYKDLLNRNVILAEMLNAKYYDGRQIRDRLSVYAIIKNRKLKSK